MPNRNPNLDQQQKGRNPAVEAPDDDESLDDPVRADQQPITGANRQAQDQRQRPEENIEQVEDEEAEDDEDESDGISQRP